MAALKIGALAKATRTSAPTIRYYESIGLLPPASRQAGGQRVYGEPDVHRLMFIRRCRDFGFPIEQVSMLVTLAQDPSRSCFEARDLAHGHLIDVRRKLAELRALELELVTFMKSCDQRCAGGAGPDCVILHELGTVGCKARRSSTAGRREIRAASRTRRPARARHNV